MKRKGIDIPSEYWDLTGRAREEYFGSDRVHDCWIVAASIATGLPYSDIAKEITTSETNWDPNRGATSSRVRTVLKRMGFTCLEINQREIIDRYPESKRDKTFVTPRQVTRFPSAWKNLPPLLLFTDAHVSCVKDGKVYDWAASSSRRVFRIDVVLPSDADFAKELKELNVTRVQSNRVTFEQMPVTRSVLSPPNRVVLKARL